MFRRPFTFAKFLIAGLALATISTAAHSASTTAQAYTTNTAGNNKKCTLVSSVQALSSNGEISGAFAVSGSNWMANYGECYSIAFSSDNQGQHATVQAWVFFSNAQYNQEPAVATYLMTKHPDGSSCVALEVDDYFTGQVLTSTGKDKTGHLITLPVINGGMFIKN
jgi:hypothetical protein